MTSQYFVTFITAKSQSHILHDIKQQKDIRKTKWKQQTMPALAAIHHHHWEKKQRNNNAENNNDNSVSYYQNFAFGVNNFLF
jgi:hypothetical protein